MNKKLLFLLPLFFGAFMVVQGGCQGDEEVLGPVPDTNYFAVEAETGSMGPALGLCYYVKHYSEYRGLSGFAFVGHVDAILDDDELAQFREENCFEGFTGCSNYPVVEVSVEEMVTGDTPTHARTRLMISSVRAEEVSKWYEGKRVLVFARHFHGPDNGNGFTNHHATFIFDDGYAFATSSQGFSHDFGQSAVTENQLRERVRELKKADPAECRWDQDGKLKERSSNPNGPDVANEEHTDSPRY